MRRSTLAISVIATLVVSIASSRGFADQQFVPPAEVVQIPLNPLPFILKGYLRRPAGAGPFPAVVLLPACNKLVKPVDQNWGEKISSWGYVTLTLDSFNSRALGDTCFHPAPTEVDFDAYRGLNFLNQQKFVDAKRAFVVGFGGSLAFRAVERGGIEQEAKHKFRAAALFYPPCGSSKGIMTIPTLILVGERDDWTPVDACRKLADGQDDMGISRQKGEGAAVQLAVIPGAYHAFDLPAIQALTQVMGHHLEFNKIATDQSSDALREFLHSMVGERE